MFSRHFSRWPRRLRLTLAASWLFTGLLVLQLVWGLWFIWRTSFEASGERVFCLFDDAMISMTYARNFADGFGLNWARFGAPVEGFTHPLWLAVMILVHLLSLPLTKTSLVLQLVSLGLLVANVWAVRRLLVRHFSAGLDKAICWLPAAAATAFYYPLHHWALQGMETALQSLLVVLATHFALDLAEDQTHGARRLGWNLALAFLLRMDLVICVAVILVFLRWRHLRLVWGVRDWLVLLAPLAVSGLAYQAFRLAYFGDWFPNTYYLKMTGVPWDFQLLRGLWTFERFLIPILPALLVVLIGFAVAVKSIPSLRLPMAIVLASWGYAIYVGGDVWEFGIGANRFVAFVMPMYFVVGNAALSFLVAQAPTRWRVEWAIRGLAAATTLLAVLSFNGLMSSEGSVRWARLTVTDLPTHVQEHRRFTRIVLGLRRSKLLAPDSRVVTVWAGIPAYFSNWQMVDLMGYNERTIAHGPLTRRIGEEEFRNYLPGHTKAKLSYALDEYRPDLVFQVWGTVGEERRTILKSRGYERRGEMWLRRDSLKVRRDTWPADTNFFTALGASEPARRGRRRRGLRPHPIRPSWKNGSPGAGVAGLEAIGEDRVIDHHGG